LIYTVRPCLIRTCNAMLRPCRSSQGHGTARLSTDGLWATCPHSASSGNHVEFHEGYQKNTNLRCMWQVSNQTFVKDEGKSGSSTLQKRRSVKLLDKQFWYFRLPCGLSRKTRHYRSMARARHGRGTAWARHAMCESVLRTRSVVRHCHYTRHRATAAHVTHIEMPCRCDNKWRVNSGTWWRNTQLQKGEPLRKNFLLQHI